MSYMKTAKARDDLFALTAELKSVNDRLEGDPDNGGLQRRGASLLSEIEAAETALSGLESDWKAQTKADYQAGRLGGLEAGSEPDGNGGGTATTVPGVKAEDARSYTKGWAQAARQVITRTATQAGVKALTSGSVDVPTVVADSPIRLPERPDRLVDLLVDRERVPGNEFEFLRQTVRTNNATAVADEATKPTSIFTVAPIEDRVRVIAHLSEPVPERLFEDHRSLERFLSEEMGSGVLDALESQVVSGDGLGENLTGILNTAGIGTTVFDTSIAISLRKAWTAMEALHEMPNAWVLNPTDAEAIDLLREQTDGGYLVADVGLSNIFKTATRVTSTSVPAGTALLGDFNEVRLFVRADTRIDADRSGVLFDTNRVKVRAEGRFGVGVLRPQAFRTVATTGP